VTTTDRGWEAVVGVETHVELQTASKMFCGCPVSFGAPPNTTVCPVCLGLPGALPVPNEAAIEGILRIGSALGCELVDYSEFSRKNYFYPDLPKNYQISQYDLPLCVNGRIEIETNGTTTSVGITRVHMEEDTGKSLHIGEGGRIADADHSLLDFNRSGVPLVEIVSEPDIRSPEEARAFGAELQRMVRALGVSDARLEEGSMRFDANISVRRPGADLGTRTEVKNVNSLRSLQRAVAFEVERQIRVLEGGGSIVQETRHWNEDTAVTRSMRSKEESEDYRYFQEPDLVPLEVDDAWRERVRDSLPELPSARRARYRAQGIEAIAAGMLAENESLGRLLDAAVAAGGDPGVTANWLTGEVVAFLRREGGDVDDTALDAGHLVELGTMVGDGDLSATAAKEVLAGVLAGEGTPGEVAGARDLLQISDVDVIEGVVDEILAEHQEALERMRRGDMKPVGFLVGQVMRASGGKADPKVVSELIRSKANGGT
jgi:aspartyl-tRNA(Asn)/glutamyl-tRNA(Gln) amidotransferase subunit B